MIPIIKRNNSCSDSFDMGYRYCVKSRGYKFVLKTKNTAFRLWIQELRVWVVDIKNKLRL